jgi:hypothetical protein
MRDSKSAKTQDMRLAREEVGGTLGHLQIQNLSSSVCEDVNGSSTNIAKGAFSQVLEAVFSRTMIPFL